MAEGLPQKPSLPLEGPLEAQGLPPLPLQDEAAVPLHGQGEAVVEGEGPQARPSLHKEAVAGGLKVHLRGGRHGPLEAPPSEAGLHPAPLQAEGPLHPFKGEAHHLHRPLPHLGLPKAPLGPKPQGAGKPPPLKPLVEEGKPPHLPGKAHLPGGEVRGKGAGLPLEAPPGEPGQEAVGVLPEEGEAEGREEEALPSGKLHGHVLEAEALEEEPEGGGRASPLGHQGLPGGAHHGLPETQGEGELPPEKAQEVVGEVHLLRLQGEALALQAHPLQAQAPKEVPPHLPHLPPEAQEGKPALHRPLKQGRKAEEEGETQKPEEKTPPPPHPLQDRGRG